MQDSDVRIFGSVTDGAGAVEIFVRIVGDWVAICTDDNTWNDEVPSVLCRQLGYESGVARTFM